MQKLLYAEGADACVECLQSKNQEIKRQHKKILHSCLSGKDYYVGLKIGEEPGPRVELGVGKAATIQKTGIADVISIDNRNE